MTDTLLLVIIALLTVNVLFVGIYIVLVLKEVRQTVLKLNRILDSFSAISNAIATPIAQAPGVVSAIVEGIKAAKSIQEVMSGKKEDKQSGTTL
ncbi:MAG: hypothetical protein UY40_C0005G0003 [candidate division CPR1 bacterium GW2011_GWC1_49_13]|uniref:DUF948 domain-containing protein n=1 Tax=candidate division CPR1 bacterium GW2011_GWC1_49_13 TaxID=1618342 RepID=A0A0G1VI77_9BACT|nr:MAG: hypothetical protein UY40_C0005G0003 [candidate division CPR1 bacterium GW2011_GWC1_49_13]